jgi:tetratricopeptide (TPR) repeat protein
MKVPLEVRKQCVSLALQQIARLAPAPKPRKEDEHDDRVVAITAFLKALPEILSPAERDKKQMRVFFEEIYRATRAVKSLSSLTDLMEISNDLGLQREPEIATDMVICLSKTKDPDEDNLEYSYTQDAVETLVAYGFAREAIAMIEQMLTDSPQALKYKQDLQWFLLRPNYELMRVAHNTLPSLNASMNEVIAYIQQLPEKERTPLRQSLGRTTRQIGQHQLANTIFEEIAQSAIKEKNAEMLFEAAQWRFRDPSREETILVPLDITWRDRVRTALTWESSKDTTNYVGRAFLGCGAWQDALEYTQKNYTWGVRVEFGTIIYSMTSPLIKVAKAFWEKGQKEEALRIYKTVRALPIPEKNSSENRALAEMAALCDTPTTALYFATRSDSSRIFEGVIKPLVKRGYICEILGAVRNLKEPFKRMQQYGFLILLARQHPLLNAALLAERKHMKEFNERIYLASLLEMNGQVKESHADANRLHQELRKKLSFNSINEDIFFTVHSLSHVFFLLNEKPTITELLRYARSRVPHLLIDDSETDPTGDFSVYYHYQVIAKDQMRCGFWQDAIETAQKITKPVDRIEIILDIAQGGESDVW